MCVVFDVLDTAVVHWRLGRVRCNTGRDRTAHSDGFEAGAILIIVARL